MKLSEYLQFSKISSSRKTSACCKADVGVIDDGNVETLATLSIQINKGGAEIPIPGLSLPTISKKFHFLGFADIDVDIKIGVFMKIESTIDITGGGVLSQCSAEEECVKASAGLGVDIGFVAKIEAIACVETFWTDETCDGLTIIPGGISSGLEGALHYNKICSEGLGGSLSTKPVVIFAEIGFDLPGVGSINYSKEVLRSFQIYP